VARRFILFIFIESVYQPSRRHAIEKVQGTLNETRNPGLNGQQYNSLFLFKTSNIFFLADQLGQGSTQATDDPSSAGNDQPFWDALNKYVKNLHAVISGHGNISSLALSGLMMLY
jgi:hypothetical protein